MTKSSTPGIVGCIIGTIANAIGSTGWIVITGISIKSVSVVVIPLLISIVGTIISIRFLIIYPKRWPAIVALGSFWFGILNLVCLNILYERMPSVIFGISTGKGAVNLVKANMMLGALSFLGFIFLIKDIVRKD